MNFEIKINQPISVEQFLEVLDASSLGERRPVDDIDCIAGMIENCNLLVTAWAEGSLIGVARSMTDFHYACYLSDLAVDKKYQGNGVGKALQIATQKQLGPKCKLILIAAPAANSYYEYIGYTNHPGCWVLDRMEEIRS